MTFELEAIDRMYLNAYVPSLQTGAGFVYFVKTQLGVRVPCQSRAPHTYSTGSMTYDLRRLRLHGLIERVPHSHRYRITPTGAKVAMFDARLYPRALRPANSLQPAGSIRAQRALDRLDVALATFLEEVKLAA